MQRNSKIGKTRYLFKKTRGTTGIYHAKMGTIKDINVKNLTEAEDIKKGGKKTQKNYTKKIFMIQMTTMV